jgi:hypothetical protein
MTELISNAFSEVRQEGDHDLVTEITTLLAEAKHPNPQAWLENETIKQAVVAAPKLQRFLVNRHFRIKLGQCPESTRAERFLLGLVEESKVGDYLKVFKEGILPVVVRHAL